MTIAQADLIYDIGEHAMQIHLRLHAPLIKVLVYVIFFRFWNDMT